MSYASVYRKAVEEATVIENAKAQQWKDQKAEEERQMVASGERKWWEVIWIERSEAKALQPKR